MSLGNTIRQGALWLFIGNSGNQILSFLFGIILARLLLPEVFGVLMTMQVFTGIAGFISGGGMGQALVRAKKVDKTDYDVVFTLQLIIGILIYMTFYFIAPWFAEWYHNPLYTKLLRVSALSFIFRPFFNIPGNILFRQMRFKAKAFISFINLIVSSTISIFMAWKGYGVWSLVIGGLGGSTSGIILNSIIANWFPRPRWNLKQAKPFARYGFLISFTDILVYLRQQTTTFILSRTLGPSAIGLFNKGESLALMANRFITGSVYQPLFRAMSKEQNNIDRSRYLFFHSLRLVSVYVFPFCVALFYIADPLILFIYGQAWVEAAIPLKILVFSVPFSIIGMLSGCVLAARNWLGREVPVQIIMIIVLVISIFSNLDKGLEGIALAVVLAQIYLAIHMGYLAGSCLHSNIIEFLLALVPAIFLNILLVAFLTTIKYILTYSTWNDDILTKGFIIGTSGLLFYIFIFFIIPFPSLSGERKRMLKKIPFLSFSKPDVINP